MEVLEPVKYTIDKAKVFQLDKGKLTPKQNGSQTSITPSKLRAIPPMVRPEKLPGRIVRDHMNPDEIKLMAGFLMGYQKGEVGWDAYRLKIPDALLLKFGAMRDECWRNGFIDPVGVIRSDGAYIILWSQVLSGTPGGKCTFCTNKPCQGREDEKGRFVMCGGKN